MGNILIFEEDAFTARGVLKLTKNQLYEPLINGSISRASYAEVVCLWDAKTRELTDFITHFSFVINTLNKLFYGDGLSFFIAPLESRIPNNLGGGYLGLFSPESTFNSSLNRMVAVEFDSYQNLWDPSDDHFGINIISFASTTNLILASSIKNGSIANAWVSYNSITKNLSVFLTYSNNSIFIGNSSLSYIVDLRTIYERLELFLLEWVRVGFSAATGDQSIELHTIFSWSFSSCLEA